MRWSLAGPLAAALVVVPTLRATASSDALAAPVDPETAADTGDETADEGDRALRRAKKQAADAAKSAFNAARDAEAAARAAGRGADGRVRDAEEDTVPPVIERLDAQQRLAAAQDALVRAEGRLAAARRMVVERRAEVEAARIDLDEARMEFEDRVVRAYKAGSLAAGSTFAITLAREAGSPGDLATTIKHLEALALVGDDRLRQAIDEVTDAEAALVDADARQAAAETALSRADQHREKAVAALESVEGTIDAAEARAAAARHTADGAEARLLAALARRLTAEARFATARRELADHDAADGVAVAAEDGSSSSAEPGSSPSDGRASDDEAADLEERRGWLTARERALRRAQTLPADRRRTADGWVCPVEGAGFVNDWGFPRSSDRRHEGTDVFAPIGTEIRAPVAGEVVRTDRTDRFDGRRDLGGITVTVEAGDQRFYFAHLDRIHPDVEVGHDLATGDVVGFVGRTGNARGTPAHLHLGWYVEGVAVNPYPSLAVACHGSR